MRGPITIEVLAKNGSETSGLVTIGVPLAGAENSFFARPIFRIVAPGRRKAQDDTTAEKNRTSAQDRDTWHAPH